VSLKHLRLVCWDNYRVYVAQPLQLHGNDRWRLEALTRASTVPAGLATRARIVLLAADGLANTDIAERTGTSRPTVLKARPL
jgi:DNA-binding NarL/FixJ family response regulator